MKRKAQQPFVAAMIGVFIFAVVATALLPTLGDQVQAALNDSSGGTNLSGTDETILRLWPTFVIIAGLLVILGAAGLS